MHFFNFTSKSGLKRTSYSHGFQSHSLKGRGNNLRILTGNVNKVSLRERKKGTHSRLCVGVDQLDSGLDGLSMPQWLCFGLAMVFRISGQVKRKVRGWAMRVREADAAHSFAVRRWDFLLAVLPLTYHHPKGV